MNLFYTLATLGTADGFCASTANIWQLIGYVLLIFRIVIPILLIIFGMIDLGKSVVAEKPEEIKKSAMSLAWRAVAAIAIFLIPTIIGFVLSFIGNFSSVEKDYNYCKACITSPTNGDCADQASKLWQ